MYKLKEQTQRQHQCCYRPTLFIHATYPDKISNNRHTVHHAMRSGTLHARIPPTEPYNVRILPTSTPYTSTLTCLRARSPDLLAHPSAQSEQHPHAARNPTCICLLFHEPTGMDNTMRRKKSIPLPTAWA